MTHKSFSRNYVCTRVPIRNATRGAKLNVLCVMLEDRMRWPWEVDGWTPWADTNIFSGVLVSCWCRCEDIFLDLWDYYSQDFYGTCTEVVLSVSTICVNFRAMNASLQSHRLVTCCFLPKTCFSTISFLCLFHIFEWCNSIIIQRRYMRIFAYCRTQFSLGFLLVFRFLV